MSKKKTYVEPEPLPCPFCGKRGLVVQDEFDGITEFLVKCSDGEGRTPRTCHVQPVTFLYDSRAEAVEAWNKRA